MLDSLRFDRPKAVYSFAAWLLLAWWIWLALISAVSLPWGLNLSAAGMILVVGAYHWTFREGLVFLLIMSLLYSAASAAPSGWMWICFVIVFGVLKIVSFRVRIQTVVELALAVFFAAWSLELIQMIFLSQMMEEVRTFSWILLGRSILSAFGQTLMAILLSRWLLQWVASK